MTGRDSTPPGGGARAAIIRDDVIAAFEAVDHDAIRDIGWWEPWEAATEFWSPKQTCNARQFVAYAKLLGGEDPAKVTGAFRDLCVSCPDWRPTPAKVLAHLRWSGEEKRMDVSRSRDRAKRPESLAAVAEALEAGEKGCSCEYRRSTWNLDGAGVLRCRVCSGLEWGQIYAVAVDRPELEPEFVAA